MKTKTQIEQKSIKRKTVLCESNSNRDTIMTESITAENTMDNETIGSIQHSTELENSEYEGLIIDLLNNKITEESADDRTSEHIFSSTPSSMQNEETREHMFEDQSMHVNRTVSDDHFVESEQHHSRSADENSSRLSMCTFIKSEEDLMTMCDIKSSKILNELTTMLDKMYPASSKHLLNTRESIILVSTKIKYNLPFEAQEKLNCVLQSRSGDKEYTYNKTFSGLKKINDDFGEMCEDKSIPHGHNVSCDTCSIAKDVESCKIASVDESYRLLTFLQKKNEECGKIFENKDV